MVPWMVRPHDEILQNLLTSKTGYVEIASRLGIGINLVLTQEAKAYRDKSETQTDKFFPELSPKLPVVFDLV
jgi:hypothetical protein